MEAETATCKAVPLDEGKTLMHAVKWGAKVGRDPFSSLGYERHLARVDKAVLSVGERLGRTRLQPSRALSLAQLYAARI